MERQQILGVLISIFMVIAMLILSEVVAKNVVHDYMLIKISLMVSFFLGLLFYMILVKLGIY
ncbi:hypothetical protein SAMN02910340_00243 [Methanosarcina thermophila]|jgi:hypothetical protein|uniref:Uncharacterized protein n=1 Tax=Methanosarcina thermophila TaxID=2210 RepID=A0A1I6X778_METTE|nr:MAG: hypothetical protein AAY43_01670 [Methanosarcina sp. 795]BAW28319.1 hypothetical protein MESMT1_0389 [Methanosarcina thermophila]GLI12997.1 hypothetical protein MTHERMMSTA1_01230 [Methanosarcina thermophila MST-A1]SFT33771.1 hypothetical protein SAMN02910340_00243 [Methanosarcina thermophila]